MRFPTCIHLYIETNIRSGFVAVIVLWLGPCVVAAVTQVRILVTAEFLSTPRRLPSMHFSFFPSSRKKAVFTFSGLRTTILQSLTDITHSFFLGIFSWSLFCYFLRDCLSHAPYFKSFFFFPSIMQHSFQISTLFAAQAGDWLLRRNVLSESCTK